MVLRAFSESDYTDLAQSYRAAYPDTPRSEEELRYLDARHGAPYKRGRWVLEREGRVVGWCEYAQHPSWYHPDKYEVNVTLRPEYHGQGLGKALYEHLLEVLVPQRPLALRTNVLETRPRQLRFFRDRGFEETQRSWLSTLELHTFDLSPHRDFLAEVAARGFEVRSVAALEADPKNLRDLYTFYQELVADLPRTEPYTPWTFEQFLHHRQNSPTLLPQGSFILMKNGVFAAVSELKKTSQPDRLQTGLTAVRRPFRRQGLALAAKLHALAYAKAQGVRSVSTRNASTNAQMLKINDKLGFVRGAADVELLKELSA